MPLLSVEELHTSYQTHGTTVHAVDGVSLHVEKGETVGLVGESGCGKSTLGKSILRLVPASSGSVRLNGVDLTQLKGRALRPYRRQAQMIFQDAFASMNPRHTVHTLLDTALAVHGIDSKGQRAIDIGRILDQVGLPSNALQRYPHQFSGGQRQRIGIARALILKPELVVCDEPVSALDVSIQAQVLNLLVDLKHELGLSYLFISHDLSVVRYFADRVLVMYLGRIVESADQSTLWNRPRHPYTQALIAAVPSTDRSKKRSIAVLQGDLPNPGERGVGCSFRARCPRASALCETEEPVLRQVAPGHQTACHHA
jgi:peptide/nickel transport system ATP-binding protein